MDDRIPVADGDLPAVLRMKLEASVTTIGSLQEELQRERQKAVRLWTWVDSLIAAAPNELRLHVTRRLDVTGTGYVPDGLWNYILHRTAAQTIEARRAETSEAQAPCEARERDPEGDAP